MLNTSSMYRLSMAPSGAPPICCSIRSSLICRTWSIALSPHLFYVEAGTLSSQNREVNTARNQRNERKLVAGGCKTFNTAFPDLTRVALPASIFGLRFGLTLRLVKHHELRRLTAPLPASGNGLALKRSEEHTSELQSRLHLVCRLLLEKKNKMSRNTGMNMLTTTNPSTECLITL